MKNVVGGVGGGAAKTAEQSKSLLPPINSDVSPPSKFSKERPLEQTMS